MKHSTLKLLLLNGFLFFGSLIVQNAQSVNAAEPNPIIDSTSLDEHLQSIIENGQAVGVSLLMFKDGKEVFYGDAGLRDREKGIPWSRDALVNIYSMTKPVTGVTLMTLYEEGLFKLDDPVSRYLPEFKNMQVFEGMDESNRPILVPAEREITILDLMRHTSGMGYDWEDNYVGEKTRALDVFSPDKPLATLSEEMASLPLHFQPGKRWLYSPAVDIQARLAEVISGTEYEQLVTDKVLKPLKMKNTGYFVAKNDKHKVTPVYIYNSDNDTFSREPDELVYGFYTTPPKQKNGGHGLISTADDYMRFALMLQNEGELDGVRILKPETIALMAKDHLPKVLDDKSWLPGKGQMGFGLDFAVRIAPPVDENEAYGVPGEFFWDGRASTLFWVDPVTDLTAVFLIQKVPFDLELQKALRAKIYQALRK
jgi:CubicO group peptidase (beta-lactamase class C family)